MQEFFNDPRGVNVEWRNCYDEAQNYFEKARADYDQTPEEKRGIAILTMIYTNLALCDMRSGKMEKTAEYIRKLDQECQPHF